VHGQLGDAFSQSGIRGTQRLMVHRWAFPATPGSGVHHLHAARAGSSPGAPCGGRAVAGTAGQVPQQPSARELA
jgi:hypothetical protein